MSCDQLYELWKKNPLRKPRIDKVTVNVSIGKSGEPLEKASRILEMLTGQKPSLRKAKKTIKDFGVRKGEPIACIVTLRKDKAMKFLKDAFTVIGNKLSETQIDKNGNFAFGIKEHIELPGVKYQPELGVIGMDVCVSISKPGYRVKLRKRAKADIGSKHKIQPNQVACFLKDVLGIEILGKGSLPVEE